MKHRPPTPHSGRPEQAATELLRRVGFLELKANRLVEDLLAGPYRSVFRGRGLEFDQIREYQPGDDIRSIDWHTTARTGTVQVKENVEERCLTVLLAVDLSASGDFGSGPQSKRELAAELCAVLALSAVMNNDRVGLLIFTEGVERFVPPRSGRRQALAVIAAVLGHQPRSPRTSVRAALRTIGQALPRRATVFLLSDFLDADFERALQIAARQHDIVALPIGDGAEAALPPLGWVLCEDAETGELIEVNSRDPAVRHAFELERRARQDRLRDAFRRAGVDAVFCQTGRPYLRALMHFFESRQQRRRGPD